MSEIKMVVVNGIRYRPEDAPKQGKEQPKTEKKVEKPAEKPAAKSKSSGERGASWRILRLNHW